MSLRNLTHLKFIEKILEAGGHVFLVGGNVRDHFLKIEHKDYDILIANLSLKDLRDILTPLGWVNQVGKSFGIIKFRPKDHPEVEFDLSLPRIEKSTGKGHRDFDVDFDPFIPVEKDLGRRDFTVNAMAFNLKSNILLDPFNGKQDLEKRILRQVFPNCFMEDPLRLLRAVQFSARFGLTIEKQTLKSMQTNASLIREISKERIIDEIRKLFMAPQPSRGFDLMRQTGLLKLIFPFIHDMIGVMQPMKNNEDVYVHTMKVLDASKNANDLTSPGNLDLMFAALLHDTGKPRTASFDTSKNKSTFYGHQIVSKRIAKKWLNDYRATTIGVDIGKVLNLIKNHMFETKAFFTERAIRRFINKIGPDHISNLIDLRIADKKGGRFPDSMKGILNLRQRIKNEMDKKPPFCAKDLALTGHDIMNMGFQEGPIIGKINKFLVEKVLDEPLLNTKEELAKLIKENFNPTQT